MPDLATAESLNSAAEARCRVLPRDGMGGEPSPLCIVDGLFPGEVAWVELGRRRRGERRGRILSVDQHKRLSPACPHVASCGGCRTQQWLYRDELAWKQERIETLFPKDADNIHPIVAAPTRFGYRNKMEWSFAQDRAGQQFLGLYGRYARGVISIQACALVHPWMSQGLAATRAWWSKVGLPAFHPHRATGLLRTVTMREGFRTGERMAILLVDGGERESLTPHLAGWVEAMRPLCKHLLLRTQMTCRGVPTWFQQELLMGEEQLQEELHVLEQPLRVAISAPAFFQPNTFAAERIYRRVIQELDPRFPVLDLFAGTGIMGLLAAQAGMEVTAVELVPEACRDAEANAQRNGLSDRYRMICGDATQCVQQHDLRGAQVILDPPRAGCGGMLCEWLVQQKPPRILYLACNPLSQQKDVAWLKGGGYQVESIHPFDQFPNTPHIENLVVLRADG